MRRSAGRRGGPGDGRPDGRGRAHPDLRPVPPRRRTHRARAPAPASRTSHPDLVRTGRVLSRRLPGRGPPRRWSAPWPTASCAAWPPPTPSSWASTSPASDAVVLAGFPGTVASFWQQAGRSGRRGQSALIVLIARDDPLDTYLVHHPAGAAGQTDRTRRDRPANPYVLGPQLLCAATELPLDRRRGAHLGRRGGGGGAGRRRPAAAAGRPGTSPPRASIPHPAVDIRGSSGGQIAIVETGTGRLLGSAGAGQAPASVHPGAVYLHQGETYVVDSLDFEDGIAFVRADDPGYTTSARELTDIVVTGLGERHRHRPRHAGCRAGVGHPHRGRVTCGGGSTAR